MKFITIRDFRTKSAAIRKELKAEKEMILTANGRPIAILARVEPDTVEDELMAIRRARARVAVDRIRAHAKAAGLDKMTMKEIDALIAEVRHERRTAG